MSTPPDTLRVDKWLWHARFFKTRSLATDVVRGGKLRVNGERVSKASATIRAGDVLTFPQADQIRVIKVTATSTRRGPATEAATLYEDLTPPGIKPSYQPRPATRDRRAAAQAKRKLPT